MWKIILADDESAVLNGLRHCICWQDLGYDVVASMEEGRAVAAYLACHPVDAVLTDIRMPGMSGIDIARYVYERRLPVQVILLSGHRDFIMAQEAMRYGVRHYLTKPFLPKDIRRVLGEVSEELHLAQAHGGSSPLDQAVRSSGQEAWLVTFRVSTPVEELQARLFAALGEGYLGLSPLEGDRYCLTADETCTQAQLQEMICALQGQLQGIHRLQHVLHTGGEICPSPVEKACRYIRTHVHEKLSLTEVARQVFLNPSYLSRLFSEEMGCTFRAYVTDLRMQDAASLLIGTDLMVHEISRQVGYHDVKHFYQQFRQSSGMSSSAYRRARKGDGMR